MLLGLFTGKVLQKFIGFPSILVDENEAILIFLWPWCQVGITAWEVWANDPSLAHKNEQQICKSSKLLVEFLTVYQFIFWAKYFTAFCPTKMIDVFRQKLYEIVPHRKVGIF